MGRQMAADCNHVEDEDISVYDIETIVLDQAFDPDALQPVIDAAAAVGAERLNICADDWDRAAETGLPVVTS